MFKAFILLVLLGIGCFSSASVIAGSQTATDHQRQLLMQSKNQPPKTSWPMTASENRLANAQRFKSQENENEIENGDSMQNSPTNSANEEKELPAQSAAPQSQQSPQHSNKNPQMNQQSTPISYATIYTGGNHPPGMPVTQYSGVQMVGYQKEQTGQLPVSQQQQMYYSGGSNAIPLVIYSNSQRPPIKIFYLDQEDKKITPSLQPEYATTPFQSTNPMMYSIQSPLASLLNIPWPLLENLQPSSSMSMWDNKQYPKMYETPITTQLPAQYYPGRSMLVKNKEMLNVKPLKAKSALAPEWIQTDFKHGEVPAFWKIPEKQSTSFMSNMFNPDWSHYRSIMMEDTEPMERVSGADIESATVGSKYTPLPTSSFRTGQAGGLPFSSYTPGGELNLSNRGGPILYQAGSLGHNTVSPSMVRPLPPGALIPTSINSQKGYIAGGPASLIMGGNKHMPRQPGSFGSNYQLPGGTRYIGASLRQSSQDSENIALNNDDLYKEINQARPANSPMFTMLPTDVLLSPNYAGNKNPDLSQEASMKFTSTSMPKSSILGSPFGARLYGTNGLGVGFGSTAATNQYNNGNQGHLNGQNSAMGNSQQYGHENVNTGLSLPLPSGGQIYTQVNSDKGYSGGNYGQQSSSLGLSDRNFNSGGLSTSQGYNSGLGASGLLNSGIGLNGLGGIGLSGLNSGLGYVGY